MFYYPVTARQRQKQIEEKEILFSGFPMGENTEVPVFQLNKEEMAECIDLKLNHNGQLETRKGITKVTSSAIANAIHCIKKCSIEGTYYTIFSGSTKLYYLDGDTPTEISSIEGNADIVPYNNVAVICDGSYLKYCDSISEVKIAYDAGPDGSQYDNYSGTDDSTLTADRVAVKFTSETWDTGYTIPITKIQAKVQESGGTASITAKLRLVADDSVLASKAYTDTVPSSSADFISIVFTSSDITNEMSLNTDYYATLEGSNFNVQCTDVASGGVAYTYSDSWSNDSTKNPIMRVHPGVPPKADFGAVSGNRIWIKNPDTPGRVYYGNLTHLDWSTSNGGGWVGTVDNGANSFIIGGLQDLYGELYVYGTQNSPYLCKLTGSSPSDYSLPLLFQKIWTTQRVLENTASDLWSCSAEGVDALSGVQEYGDLRTFSMSESIKNRFQYWDSDTAFSGYYALDGQYWLYMPEYDYVNICQIKLFYNGKYPWIRYTLPITPSCFSQIGRNFYIGSTNGHIYKYDTSESLDLGTDDIDPSFRTSYVEIPYGRTDLTQFQGIMSTATGSTLNINYYKNGVLDSITFTKTMNLSISDLANLTITKIENVVLSTFEDVSMAPGKDRLFFNTNIHCYSFQIGVSDIKILYDPVYINSLLIRFRQMEV